MLSVNQQILDFQIEGQINLDRFSANVRQQVLAYLVALKQDIEDQIFEADINGVVRTAFQRARQEDLINQIDELSKQAYKGASIALSKQLINLAEVETFRAGNVINLAMGVNVAKVTLAPDLLKELITNSMIRGIPQKEWWTDQTKTLQRNFAQQIRLGVGQGETNQQLVQRVRGRATGKVKQIKVGNVTRNVREFSGGIMDVSTREAEALVRTSVQTVSNNVQQRMHEENSDLLRGVLAVATLDGRTTPLCRSRDGGRWDLNTGKWLSDSTIKIMFPGYPPWHWNCRTVIVVITKSWQQLNDMVNMDGLTESQKRQFQALSNKLDKIPESTRVSMDGQVPESMTYEKWFKTKSTDFQREVLGNTKYGLWKRGGLTFQQMVDQSGNPLTIAQLRAKYNLN